MSDDAKLLGRFVAEKSEEAFTELVRQHLPFVYHTALRHLPGDPCAAQEVAQIVFTDLARKAAHLHGRPVLAGWLHTSTRFAALKYRRTERRRKARELEANLMQHHDDPGLSANWERLRPVVDEALEALDRRDREAVILRFFHGLGFAELGRMLQLSEDGARSRVDRALERMQVALERRGVTSTGAALAIALGAQAGATVPAGLAAAVTGAALGGAAVASTATFGVFSLMKVASLALGVSVAANAALGIAYLTDVAPAESAPSVSTASAYAPASPVPRYDRDISVFHGRLLAAGIPEHLRRALIEAEIERQFRAREEALKPARPVLGWWQWDNTRIPMETSLALLDLKREKARLKLALLGPDSEGDAGEPNNPIPPEKREQLKLIAEDYGTMLAAVRVPGPLLPAESARIAFLEENRRKDLATLLTTDELRVFEERNWNALWLVSDRLQFFDATPAEFAAIKASLLKSQEESKSFGGTTVPNMDAEIERVREAIGEARFEEYERSRRPEFRDLQALLERSGRSRSEVIPIHDLWKAIERNSYRIVNRSDLTNEEKHEELRQLASRTRAGILENLGPEIGAAYLNRNHWLRLVEEGSAVIFSPSGFQSIGADDSPGPRGPVLPSRLLRNP